MNKHGFILEYLETFLEEITPREFYRGIFPEGELEKTGIQEKGKYNGVAVEIYPLQAGEKKPKTNRYTITDDLNAIDLLQESDNFVIVSPISYAGKSRKSENARFIYALAIDLDGVDDQQHLTDLFYQIGEVDYVPKPTYIVASGNGLHLYYKFEKPIPCFNNIVQALARLKLALTKRIWNKFVTTQCDKVQIQSLFQGFRLVGGTTKQGVQTRTKAFVYGDPVTIAYLNEFVPAEDQVESIVYKSNLTLQQAKEKYPEWYEKRIVQKKPANTWTCKRDLYDWWIRRITSEASVGHRYYCIMCMCIYAKKCGIDYEELEQDAYAFIDRFDNLTTEESNHFTEEDVSAALDMYNDNYMTFPIHSIEEITDINIERNRRNFRPQKVHLARIRALQEYDYPDGQWRNVKGRPNKEALVKKWKEEHPNGKKSECVRDLNIDRKTVSKYWE